MRFKALFASVISGVMLLGGLVYAGETNLDSLTVAPTTSDTYGLSVKDSSGTVQWYVDSDGTSLQTPVVINSYSQLFSFTGANAAKENGVSYYQMSPGKRYFVDLPALSHSLRGYNNAAGVSMMMWDASVANNNIPSEITIIPGTAPYTESTDSFSGATKVLVVPFPAPVGTALSSVTIYGSGARGGIYTPQTIQEEFQDSNGVVNATNVLAGGSIWFLNKVGESVTVQTRNASGISAFSVKSSTKK